MANPDPDPTVAGRVNDTLRIVASLNKKIDEFFGLSALGICYTNKLSSVVLCKRKPSLKGEALITTLLETIRQNRCSLTDQRRPANGKEAWRWMKNKRLDPGQRSLEIRIERAIARLLDEDWTNQVPTASGLTEANERRRSVDLVHRCTPEEFHFIELKAVRPGEVSRGHQTPLFAAMEILIYGLIFLYCKENRLMLYGDTATSRPVLEARMVHLEVLANKGCYEHSERKGQFPIAWLNRLIGDGISYLNRTQDVVHFDFAFKAFPERFEWTEDDHRQLLTADVDSISWIALKEKMQVAVGERQLVPLA